MCGIAGRWGPTSGLDSRTLSLLTHRGPDDSGAFRANTSHGTLELLQTRLAILDVSTAGHQPMCTPDGRYTIVLNGEIYNYRTLRETLQRHVQFVSQTDTEVVLHGYAQWGSDVFSKLDGMFAIAIWDMQEETLVLARDPLGIKPLYVTHSPYGVTFASELKAILVQRAVNRSLRQESIAEYLSFLWIPEPHTMFREIEKLPAGSYSKYQGGKRQSFQAFYDLRRAYEKKLDLPEQEVVEAVQRTLTGSITAQMVSDVTIGAFYSGGLDSTTIVLEMAKASDRDVITETVGFRSRDQAYDIAPSDILYARKALKQLPANIDYHEIMIEQGSLDLLPEVVGMLDDPIGDPAAISTLLISRAVKSRATVMLSGMGAEELWGGYARYWATLSALNMWGRVSSSNQDVLRKWIRAFPSSRPWPMMGSVRQAKKFMRSDGKSLADTFTTFESYFSRNELDLLLSPAWRGGNPWQTHAQLFSSVSHLDPLDQMSYVDSRTFLPSLNLAYTDRASMAASIEVRVPFLSTDMVELSARLPSFQRVRGRVGKYIIRRAAERMGVPREVVWRKKSGFGAPVRAWMSRQVHPLIEELLSPDTIAHRGIFNSDYIQDMRRLNREGREDYALQLYSIMVLEQWFRCYIDGASPSFNAEESTGVKYVF